MSGGPDGVVAQGGEQIVRDLLDRADAVDRPQRAGPAVVVDHLGKGLELDRKPGPDRVCLVVDPLDELTAIDVTAARLLGRVRVLVVDVNGARAARDGLTDELPADSTGDHDVEQIGRAHV